MRARLTHPRGLLIVSGACFVALAVAAVLAGAVPADAVARDALLALATPAVVAVMRIANWGGDKYVLVPATLLLVVVFSTARRRWWIWLGLMVAAPAVEGVVKELIGRPRPEGLGFGFPSGHATAAAAFFGAVLYLAGSVRSRGLCMTLRVLALVAVAMVGMARIILRAHWPSDVLGGIGLGLALASAAALLDTRRGAGRR